MQHSVTVTFNLPDQHSVVEIIKALGADLAFLEARTNLPGLTVADHPLAAATPAQVTTTGTVHQLALPMEPKRTRKVNQAKGYKATHPAVALIVMHEHHRLQAAAKGRSTVDNMVSVLDYLGMTYGVNRFRVDLEAIGKATGLTHHVVVNAITALGNAKLITKVAPGHRAINWTAQ